MALSPFTRNDFDLFSREKTKDPQWDGPRLVLKRKLQAWGEAARERIRQEAGLSFKVQTSLHRPYKHNGYRVSSQRVILTPPAERKKDVARLLGEAFRKETSSGVLQMHLALTVSFEGVETALRVPPQAWWHGLAWQEAAGKAPGRLVSLLRELPEEFYLETRGGKRPRDCRDLEERDLAGLMKGYKPGENWISLRRAHPREGLLEGMEDQEWLLLDDLAALAPIQAFLEEFTWKG